MSYISLYIKATINSIFSQHTFVSKKYLYSLVTLNMHDCHQFSQVVIVMYVDM